MPDRLLLVLNLCLLALLYLFFLRVLWAVWAEVRGPSTRQLRQAAEAAAITGATPAVGLPTPAKKQKRKKGNPSKLVVIQPSIAKGTTYGLAREMTIGRAAGCQVSLADDTFVSQLHARVFLRDGQAFVEDLGSTNGTYLNGNRVTNAVPMQKGDTVQTGKTVLEVS
jgi:hypothetical protein